MGASLLDDHDPEGRSGLAHLIEHVYMSAAAGNEKARTSDEFMRRYPEGANAQTGNRYTVFATVFPATDLDRELAGRKVHVEQVIINGNQLTMIDSDGTQLTFNKVP